MERDKKRQTDRHMTRDLECQEFQKRGERKREREREKERKKERDILQMCTHLYLYFFTVTRSSLLALSSHVGLSLSLSLSLSLCVCTNVDVYSYVVLYSSLPPLFLSLSLTDIHTHSGTEQNYRCQATTRLWPEKMLKKSLMETRACACELTRTNPRAQKGI